MMDCFATEKEAKDYVKVLVKKGYDRNRLFIYDDTKHPELTEKGKPYTVNLN